MRFLVELIDAEFNNGDGRDMTVGTFIVDLSSGDFATTLHLPATMDARMSHHYILRFTREPERRVYDAGGF
jgi:hypothetical protein